MSWYPEVHNQYTEGIEVAQPNTAQRYLHPSYGHHQQLKRPSGGAAQEEGDGVKQVIWKRKICGFPLWTAALVVLVVIGGLVSGLVGGLVGRAENGDSARSTPSTSESSIRSSLSSSHSTLSASTTSTVATGPASTPGSSLRSSFKISSIAASRTGNPGHIHIFYLESGTLKARIFGDEGWVSLDIDLSIPAKRGSPLASISWVDDGRDQKRIGSV